MCPLNNCFSLLLPPKSAIAQAEAVNAGLMADAERVISPLKRAIKFGITTSDVAIKVEVGEMYTVKLNCVDPSKPA
ncbi:tail fiber assembly protein [Citrobacter sp. ANG330]|uniref:tail fiber assembly protein n=1 Tax=Citrobacter sp. ANG330 TaxID=3048142 RepID=UPI0039C04E19